MYRIICFLICLPCFAVSVQSNDLVAKEVKGCPQAIKLAKSQKWDRARIATDSRTCPMTATVVWWLDLKRDDVTHNFKDYVNFINAHQHWPWIFVMRNKAELAADDTVKDKDLISWFRKYPPKTGKASLYYVAALLRTGQKDQAIAALRHAWVYNSFTESDAKKFLSKYKAHLRYQDHWKRADQLLRNEQIKQAKRMLTHLNKLDTPWARARLALLTGAPTAVKLVSAVPKQRSHELGLIYDRVKAARKRDDLHGAKIFLDYVPAKITRSAIWWKEQNYLARESLNQGQPKLAYEVMRNHQHTYGEEFVEAEWFLGWISLIFLHNPERAYKHFQKLYIGSKTAVSKAKAAYWCGRAAADLGKDDKARYWYEIGAKSPTTYYGQLAVDKLGRSPEIRLKDTIEVASSEVKAFERKEFVKVVKLLAAMDNTKEALPFLYLLGIRAKNRAERLLTLYLTKEILPSFSVRAARALEQLESLPFAWAYPVKWIKTSEKDHLLALAIIRQESSFDPGQESPAGAKGLMQLMLPAAQDMAKELQIAFLPASLMADPEYNVKLGKRYLETKLENFDGSYLLTIASYNAGERPVREWIKRNGDPRANKVDIVNWIELIPYPETRTYVQRVLANLYVYQHVLKRI